MLNTNTITLLTDSDPMSITDNKLGLLFESAPDSPIRSSTAEIIQLRELIGMPDQAKQKAYLLSEKLLQGEPMSRNIRQLGIFQEVVIRELQSLFYLIHLHEKLLALKIKECRLISASRWSNDLKQLAPLTGNAYAVRSPDSAAVRGGLKESIRRSLKRALEKSFSAKAIKAELAEAMRRIDPFRRTQRLLPLRTICQEKKRWWFVSTAHTFTDIGLLYEPLFPAQFIYMVENPRTGGAPLQARDRHYEDLYDYADNSMIPLASESVAAAVAINRHLSQVSLCGEEHLVRELFLKSDWLQHFFQRLLPPGLFLSSIANAWADAVEPFALVVGNPVFEGYFIHAAKKRNIPTILLQHGIFGDYYQYMDHPVDHYIARGTFWRNFLSSEARSRTIVFNPPTRRIPALKESQKHKKQILFVTAPYYATKEHEFWHDHDLYDILSTLVAASAETGCPLLIRVHPRESIDYYRQFIERITRDHSLSSADVRFEQGGSLDQTLASSLAAVTFYSTIFLDCLRHNVPIISFDWHDFSFKRQMEEQGVFHFAKSLEDLQTLLLMASKGDLTTFVQGIEPFISPNAGRKLLESELDFPFLLNGIAAAGHDCSSPKAQRKALFARPQR